MQFDEGNELVIKINTQAKLYGRHIPCFHGRRSSPPQGSKTFPPSLTLPAITILETAIFYWGVRDLPTNKMILKLFLREKSPPLSPC